MFGAGTSIEHEALGLDPDGGVQFNVALNDRCMLTHKCGQWCVLAHVDPERAVPMDAAMQRRALVELLEAGRAVRHVSICAKEPLESPEQLSFALEAYHRRPRSRRPQAVGMITNGLLIPHHVDWLARTPLDWAITSLDGMPRTHHRGAQLFPITLRNILLLRDRGGARVIGVNTAFDGSDVGSILELGHLLESEGVDYWNLGQFLGPLDGRIQPTVDLPSCQRVLDAVAERFAHSPMRVVFELDEAKFDAVRAARPMAPIHMRGWRTEITYGAANIRVAAMNPKPGWFYRLRFDGAIMDKAEAYRVGGVREPAAGYYVPGRIRQILAAPHTQEILSCTTA